MNPSTALMSRLRSETRLLHDRIEAVSFHRRLALGDLSLSEYSVLLEALKVVHEGLEQMRSHVASPVASLSAGLLCLTQVLEQDLRDVRALSFTPCSAEPLGAAKRYIESLQRKVDANPLELLGHLYVSHGSLLGGLQLRPLFIAALEWPPEQMRYFGGLGHGLPLAWRGFRQAMDEHRFERHDQDLIVHAACDAFRGLTTIYEAFPNWQADYHEEVG
jgi:heme oxygenase